MIANLALDQETHKATKTHFAISHDLKPQSSGFPDAAHSREPGVILNSIGLLSRNTVMVVSLPIFSSPISDV